MLFRNKKRTINPDMKGEIRTWLRLVGSQFANSPSLTTRFQNAITRFEKSDYRETIRCMKSMCLGYEMLRKERALSHKQFAENCMLKIWLEQLRKL